MTPIIGRPVSIWTIALTLYLFVSSVTESKTILAIRALVVYISDTLRTVRVTYQTSFGLEVSKHTDGTGQQALQDVRLVGLECIVAWMTTVTNAHVITGGTSWRAEVA